MSRSDRPRTHPEITSGSNALVRVTPAPNNREQNAWSVPRSLGRCSSTAPIVVFTVLGGWWPLRLPGRSASPRRSYLARPKNSSTSASNAAWNTNRTLRRATSSRIDVRSWSGSEQLVDLGADALDRRYSSCHGCRSSLVLGGSREPTPVARLHQGPDATSPCARAACCRRWRPGSHGCRSIGIKEKAADRLVDDPRRPAGSGGHGLRRTGVGGGLGMGDGPTASSGGRNWGWWRGLPRSPGPPQRPRNIMRLGTAAAK
jgi:hypothetical protein